MYVRYALFYTPPPGALDAAGASWLGWSSRLGEQQAPARGSHVTRAAPYGFHGTLVAPFTPRASEEVLIGAVADLATNLHPVQLDGLELSCEHGFFALRPLGDLGALVDLARRCVEQTHPLRQMPDEAELARRRRARLTARQDANLMRWGYPYVMQDFAFHMTLTGRIKRGQDDLRAAINQHFADALTGPMTLDALTLMGQRSDGHFVQLTRVPLTGTSASISPSA